MGFCFVVCVAVDKSPELDCLNSLTWDRCCQFVLKFAVNFRAAARIRSTISVQMHGFGQPFPCIARKWSPFSPALEPIPRASLADVQCIQRRCAPLYTSKLSSLSRVQRRRRKFGGFCTNKRLNNASAVHKHHFSPPFLPSLLPPPFYPISCTLYPFS